ncbi:hypothetical protein HHX47_DHR7000742 [Lentinula edodes]|nr:hypothetical protein HHX47_DHR7000742 [Lentinula edodes]
MSSYKIDIPPTALSTLKSRLENAVFPDELEDSGWAYGAPLADIKRLVARWRDGFDWRHEEQKLNAELPQFTRDIEVDGFAGSGDARLPVFDVVALSLPGFGFSEGPKKTGFSFTQYAEVSHKLMLALGYTEYVTQGGDWGASITKEIARRYGGEHSKAWHINLILAGPPETQDPSSYTAIEKDGLARLQEYKRSGNGYYRIQATKPQTLGYSLADSPVGLLAWIYEKLVNWTDAYLWTDDEVLTWVSIYWFSRAGPAASLRIYYEVERAGQGIGRTSDSHIPTTPLGFSHFPKELGRIPKAWYHLVGNVVFEVEHDSGGHFAAHEKPELLVGDLQKMFGKSGPAFGVVLGRNGYDG